MGSRAFMVFLTHRGSSINPVSNVSHLFLKKTLVQYKNQRTEKYFSTKAKSSLEPPNLPRLAETARISLTPDEGFLNPLLPSTALQNPSFYQPAGISFIGANQGGTTASLRQLAKCPAVLFDDLKMCIARMVVLPHNQINYSFSCNPKGFLNPLLPSTALQNPSLYRPAGISFIGANQGGTTASLRQLAKCPAVLFDDLKMCIARMVVLPWLDADGSVETGCFDKFCPGFVQVNKEIALGAAIHPVSTVRERPYPIIIYIFKDPKTNSWWVNYGERINIGYWPGDLFNSLRVHAQTVQWGGEVYSSRIGINHPHTKMGMGNGDFSYVNDSGSVKRIRIVDNSLVLKYPGYTYPYADEIHCYDCFLFGDILEPEFYFGGPGKNWRRP
ncbi:hypothetical protein ACH5RR_039744 [Cinchona calisaya]|uniref:Neprosin PEP catalytic domain-containing protein n=1 Tax=Cinchona calisaya TaxID=153742 RepID=A0ABD2Y1N2_9GENT